MLLLLAAGALEAQEQGAADHEARLAALVERYQEARAPWLDAFRAASSNDERQALTEQWHGAEWAEEFRQVAVQAARTQAAPAAWMWVLRVAPDESRDLCHEAIRILIGEHLDSAVTAELPVFLRYRHAAYGDAFSQTGLQTIVDESTEPAVNAAGLFNYAGFLLDKRPPSEVQLEQARSLFEELREIHSTLMDDQGRTYAALADGALRGMEISQGRLAPEIEGEDLNGLSLRLSDYRGKVVLIDFWGDWCLACRISYPYMRSLAERLANAPFAIVGVNSDTDLDQLRAVLAKERISWRSFWNGPRGPEGAISTAWNVEGWPMMYLLDHTGVIRHIWMGYPEHDVLDEAVDKLIAEAQTGG